MIDERAFTTRHAYLTLLGLLASLGCRSSVPLATTALASIGCWLWQQRALFRTHGFGIANAITSVRLVSLVVLAGLFDAHQPLPGAWLAFAIFSLDGLDGYLARRTHTVTQLGALYDAEVDANFTLLLTLGLFQLDNAGVWVLIGGLLRYAYVVALHLTRTPSAEAPRTRLGRYGFGLSVSGYTLSLWPAAAAATLLSGLATALLCYSFAYSFRASFGPAQRSELIEQD